MRAETEQNVQRQHKKICRKMEEKVEGPSRPPALASTGGSQRWIKDFLSHLPDASPWGTSGAAKVVLVWGARPITAMET
jgi:hypothetical protein